MRTLSRFALPVVAAAALAACGSGADSSSGKPVDGLAVVSAAQQAGQKAGSAKMSMTMTIKGGGESFTLSGTGAFDYTKQLGQMTMTVPDEQGGPGVNLETVITDTAVYTKIPGADPAKPWVKVDLTQQLGGTISQLSSGSDPSSALELLRGAKTVTTVGTEDVRGHKTTHYKAVVDLAKATANQPAGVQEKLKAYQQLLGTNTANLPVDVWIDDEGRPARFQMTMNIPASAETDNQAVDMDMTVETYDYGTKVSVTVPPESQVTEKSPGG